MYLTRISKPTQMTAIAIKTTKPVMSPIVQGASHSTAQGRSVPYAPDRYQCSASSVPGTSSCEGSLVRWLRALSMDTDPFGTGEDPTILDPHDPASPSRDIWIVGHHEKGAPLFM